SSKVAQRSGSTATWRPTPICASVPRSCVRSWRSCVAGERRTLPWRVWAVSASGSLFLALGAPPHGTTWTIWLGFAPLVWAAKQLADRSWRARFVAGWIGGMCVGLVGFPWIAELLVRFADAPLPLAGLGLAIFSAWTAIPFGIWCALLDPHARSFTRA